MDDEDLGVFSRWGARAALWGFSPDVLLAPYQPSDHFIPSSTERASMAAIPYVKAPRC